MDLALRVVYGEELTRARSSLSRGAKATCRAKADPQAKVHEAPEVCVDVKAAGWVVGTVGALACGLWWATSRYEIVLRLKDDVQVTVRGELPLQASVEQDVSVGLSKEFEAKVRLGKLAIPLDETLAIPLNFALTVPLDSEVSLDSPIRLALEVPIDTVLTERDLDLSQLVIPIDTEVMVDDIIDVEVVVPLDSHVKTALGITVPVKADLPVKLKIPIRQKIRVRDRIHVKPDKLRLPLHTRIPVDLTFQLRDKLRVRGDVKVPLRETLHVRLKQTIRPDLQQELPVHVSLDGQLPARLKATLDAKVSVNQAIPTHLGVIRIDASDVTVAPRTP